MLIKNKTDSPHPLKRKEGGRLVYYRSRADNAYWDRHWQNVLTPDYYSGAQRGSLGYFQDIFCRYLPKDGRILEAGCGPGDLVLALRKRGYHCEGVEWGEKTVKKIHELLPDLPVRTGDVSKLDVPDEYYKGYISIGVVEHRQAGPEPFLNEAYRILDKQGVMLLSVPHFNTLRRLKARYGFYNSSSDGLEFYQQAFTIAEMSDYLQSFGFRINDTIGYDIVNGLMTEIPVLASLLKVRGIGPRLKRTLKYTKWAHLRIGHMILFACRKVS